MGLKTPFNQFALGGVFSSAFPSSSSPSPLRYHSVCVVHASIDIFLSCIAGSMASADDGVDHVGDEVAGVRRAFCVDVLFFLLLFLPFPFPSSFILDPHSQGRLQRSGAITRGE